ncbi:cytochrome P450 [Actinopolyspora erythraea]|uniref:Cytochrome P450 n=1 Tax=Actinopolyspora erythraea TaxID=414996 RepID=A0A099D5H9_9ACTN|nr:cytochrome P450 [Actinopolyspora erythraea]AIS23781.1 TDP-4-keto-6-deoxyglucose 3,4-isomerase [Actinopolyspora erythraea]ASU79079.1 cytochrome P450 [Actinopolyspora erythraea]KGI81201.1 TDP-4-keto-6-deoxy-glucose 3,4-isomerase [Actinopolyspora erythraea]
MTTTDRAALGRQLQMIRGLYWGYGSNGDPYPVLLCGHDDPQRWYHRMRGSGVRRSRTETWVVADYATARQVLDNPALTRDTGRTPEWMRAAGAPPAEWAQPFRDMHASSWEGEVPDVGALEERLVGLLPGAGARLDLVRDFAWRVPERGMGAVLGAVDTEALRDAAWATRVGLDAQLSPQRLAVTETAVAALPTEPALRALFAGAEMTANILVNTILAISAEPGLAERIADDPAAARRTVAEVLRLHPALHLERRTATAELRLGEHVIGEGDEVVVIVAAANRDPDAFAEPDRLDVDRADADRALSAHRGHPGRLDELVTALATAALRAVAPSLPGLEPSGPIVRRHRSPVLRGINRCPVEL